METDPGKAHRAMFSVGLTGGIGSGKTLVADRLGALGATIIDTDLLAHAITAPGGAAMPAIEREFGPEYVTAEGALDRARMRALVFGDETARRRLEAITHPLIRAASNAAADAATGPYRVFVVPLLVESEPKGNWRKRVDRVLVVDCSTETQIARVMSRNGFTRDQVEAIIARQASRDARLAVADDVIENDRATREAICAQVDALHERYLLLAQAH
jgi:dephospho-CoA kinase